MFDRPLGKLFVVPQRLLPTRLMRRGVHAFSRCRNRVVKNALIRAFVWFYNVDVTEAEYPVPDGYPSFNAFFTRSLRTGARRPNPDPAAVLSPADGTVQQIGRIEGELLLQVKGITYSLTALFGGDAQACQRYSDGVFATIYLAPYNYHRVHAPLAGRVLGMAYVPGRLWSVNAATVRRVPGLFTRNERLICHCEGPRGPFAVILVGAMNVGSISTAWTGELPPRAKPQRWSYTASDPAVRLSRGALLGQFNLGSTVIIVLPPDTVTWDAGIGAGARVQVGQPLGRYRSA
jgi:phosphatidylserine decarboxylase